MTWKILTDSKLIENLGWTLVHSVWQFVLVALCLFFVLRIFDKLSASVRYVLAVVALGFTFVLTVVRFRPNRRRRQRHLRREIKCRKILVV